MILEIPFAKIKKIRIINERLTAEQVKAKHNPDVFMNGFMYDLLSGKTITRVKDNGVAYGYMFTDDGIGVAGNRLVWCRYDDDDILDFGGGSPILRRHGKVDIDWGNTYSEYIDRSHWRSAIGFDKDKLVLYVSDDSERLEVLAEKFKLDYLINLDGESVKYQGSCHLQRGDTILRKSDRANASWILIWGVEETKTNEGLVEHCKTALAEGWGYVYGTWGNRLTEAGLRQKLIQYPNEVGRHEAHIRANYLGERTVDCGGLIKSYLWWAGSNPFYQASTDASVDMMLEQSTQRGQIGSLPETPGAIVWYKGHAGVYIGASQVIEARGTVYGVVQTSTADRPWTHWFKHKNIEYVQRVPEPIDDISEWAIEPRKFVMDKKISDGLRPKDIVTREELWTMLYRQDRYFMSIIDEIIKRS